MLNIGPTQNPEMFICFCHVKHGHPAHHGNLLFGDHEGLGMGPISTLGEFSIVPPENPLESFQDSKVVEL